MTIVTPDISARLKPDFIHVVHVIYREMCNLRSGEQVLVITDARTPDHISGTFQGVAKALGAEAVTIETAISVGGPTYQPSAKWSPMLAAAACKADLIIDLVVGYAPFVAEAIERGARVLCPSDGISGPFTDEMLIRTIRDTDIYAIRKNALIIADGFTKASSCTLVSGDGDRLVVDIRGTSGGAYDGFLWDRDKQEFVSKYSSLPPAQPGVMLSRGRSNGTVTVDGTILWHPLYHERPDTPLKLRFEEGRVVEIGGDRYLSNRLRHWLESLEEDSAWEGPNHINLGINPNAVLTQSQEFERVYGTVTCGMGDLSLGSGLFAPGSKHVHSQSKVHWDWLVMQPTVLLDDRVILQEGRLIPMDRSRQ